MDSSHSVDREKAEAGEARPAHFDGFLFIGEVATATGADPKTIRFYERAGLLSPPRHGRFRTYLDADVRRLKDILTMRKMGLSLAHIRSILEQAGNQPAMMAGGAVASLLATHLDTLRARQAEVARQLEETSSALHRCDGEKHSFG
jgi:MerR family mercuric resistance operon transcriptional regulator